MSALQSKQFKQVGTAMLGLLHDPLPHDSASLQGATHGERRVDVGEYRIIYSIDGDTVEVLVIGKRNDDGVCKKWARIR